MSIERPVFANKAEGIAWEIKNHDLIVLSKKNEIKSGDTITCKSFPSSKDSATKSESSTQLASGDSIAAKLVINTTNIIDTHMDCHIPGLWNKSLKETSMLYLLQEHQMDFKHVIADSINEKLVASTTTITWKELGFSYPGKTEALIFDTTITKARNEYMFEQYKAGYVLNHSVGMRYIKLYLCVDSDDAFDASYKENWDKYYPQVVNKEAADEYGFFWAVTEARVVEGSAVVKGSNCATPVYSLTDKIEPSSDTQTKDAAISTSTKRKHLI